LAPPCRRRLLVVLLAAVTVLVVVLLLQPRSPYLAVWTASLDALVYDQQGAPDDVQLSLLVVARNANACSAASFSRLELRLASGLELRLAWSSPGSAPTRSACRPRRAARRHPQRHLRAPILLAQRHRAPLQLQLQVQVQVLLTRQPPWPPCLG